MRAPAVSVFVVLLSCLGKVAGWRLVPSAPLSAPLCLPVPSKALVAPGCGLTNNAVPDCRTVEDGFVTAEEQAALLRIASVGMKATAAGPTIFDADSGFLRRAGVFTNVYKQGNGRSSPAVALAATDLAVYAAVVERVRARVAAVHGLAMLHLTAPTFMTRIVGDALWVPADEHDEYFHAHADGLSTPHYAYSGLLYLSTHDANFSGGRFRFYAAEPAGGTYAPDSDREAAEDAQPSSSAAAIAGDDGHEVLIEPRAGRLLTFSAGAENWHRVERVGAGERYVLSLWFTCDATKRFRPRYDGRAHSRFDGGARLHTGGSDDAAEARGQEL